MKKYFLFPLCLILFACGIYTAGWFYYAALIDREVAKFIEDQKQNKILFEGIITPAHGFPGVYKIVYTGDISTPSGKLTIPKLELSGIPLEGQNIAIQAPLGLSISHNRLLPDHLKKVEYAALTVTIPTHLPPAFIYPFLEAWQKDGDAQIEVPSLILKWPDASIYADVQLRLNDALQPEGEAMLGVTNHTFFLELIAKEIGMSNTQKIMALTFLNALDRRNGAVVIPFSLKENALYLGIIRLGAVPFIYWPHSPAFSGRVRPDSPPVPRQ